MSATEDEHVPTDQETLIYEAITAGDWDTVEQMRADTEDPEQFEIDYQYAYAHYQADHEPSEQDREQWTDAQVTDENTTAGA